MLAVTVMLFVVLDAVGVKSFGANLSMFVTFAVCAVGLTFVPSEYTNVITQLLLTVNGSLYAVLDVVGLVPSVVYLVVNPVFVGSVTVTLPLVHVVGEHVAIVGCSIVPVPFVTVPVFVFPALSFASTVIVWSVVCVKLSHVYVPFA